jgi:hypothetical protein
LSEFIYKLCRINFPTCTLKIKNIQFDEFWESLIGIIIFFLKIICSTFPFRILPKSEYRSQGADHWNSCLNKQFFRPFLNFAIHFNRFHPQLQSLMIATWKTSFWKKISQSTNPFSLRFSRISHNYFTNFEKSFVF